MIGALGGFVVGIATSFKRNWAPVTAPIYAVLQGLFIGGISLVMEQRFPGLVLQAVLLTFGVMFALLAAFQSRIIRPSATFRAVIVSATLGIAIVYMVSMVLQLFFHTAIPMIFDNGPVGIIFSLVVVGIAALNLVLDFDFIEQGIAAGAPKWMEWYAAFALTVTLVLLYIEILRLLDKFILNLYHLFTIDADDVESSRGLFAIYLVVTMFPVQLNLTNQVTVQHHRQGPIDCRQRNERIQLTRLSQKIFRVKRFRK
jgi:uncharacterized YccA/Bax inhibitor family protein